MRPRLLFVLLIPLLLPGCAFPGSGGDPAGPPAEPGDEGPHFLFLIQNSAGHATSAYVQVAGPDGRVYAHGNFTAPAGETTEHAIPTAGSGAHRVAIHYTFSSGGRGGFGNQEAALDTSTCPTGVVHVTLRVTQDEQGRTSSSTRALCVAS